MAVGLNPVNWPVEVGSSSYIMYKVLASSHKVGPLLVTNGQMEL